ncbi:MAG: NTP transferase domain-containing protein [Thermoplasmata archaeon]|nr:NTP transferase domain-containing protein [Thermoplasmata archaeon]
MLCDMMKVVILAGGKGRRLKPYTVTLPKPLVPVGDKPIMEIVIRQLAKQGIKDMIISVGHLADLIEAYFANGEKLGVSIKYAKETEPLGTAGPLNLVKDDLNETFILINGDTLSKIKYSEVVDFHKKNEATATVVLTKRQHHVDYGVVEADDENNIVNWIEKPSLDYVVSTGIYILEPGVLNYIKPDTRMDFPDLIKELIKNGETVKAFYYDDYWLDIGRPHDYQKACEDIEDFLGEELEI